jgi:hypothetical protein
MFWAMTYIIFLLFHLMIKWKSICDYSFTCNDHIKWQRVIKNSRKIQNIRNVQSFISCLIRLRSYFQEKCELTQWYRTHWITFIFHFFDIVHWIWYSQKIFQVSYVIIWLYDRKCFSFHQHKFERYSRRFL